MNRLAVGVSFIALAVQCFIVSGFGHEWNEDRLLVVAFLLAFVGFVYLARADKEANSSGPTEE